MSQFRELVIESACQIKLRNSCLLIITTDGQEQLLKIHNRIENSKVLMLNHANDYNENINDEDVKSLGIKLLLLE